MELIRMSQDFEKKKKHQIETIHYSYYEFTIGNTKQKFRVFFPSASFVSQGRPCSLDQNLAGSSSRIFRESNNNNNNTLKGR